MTTPETRQRALQKLEDFANTTLAASRHADDFRSQTQSFSDCRTLQVYVELLTNIRDDTYCAPRVSHLPRADFKYLSMPELRAAAEEFVASNTGVSYSETLLVRVAKGDCAAAVPQLIGELEFEDDYIADICKLFLTHSAYKSLEALLRMNDADLDTMYNTLETFADALHVTRELLRHHPPKALPVLLADLTDAYALNVPQVQQVISMYCDTVTLTSQELREALQLTKSKLPKNAVQFLSSLKCICEDAESQLADTIQRYIAEPTTVQLMSSEVFVHLPKNERIALLEKAEAAPTSYRAKASKSL